LANLHTLPFGNNTTYVGWTFLSNNEPAQMLHSEVA